MIFLFLHRPFSASTSICLSLGFLSPPRCQAGFHAGEASEEEEEEQLQCERNTDSHQGDPQEDGRVVLQTAGVDFLFSSLGQINSGINTHHIYSITDPSFRGLDTIT